MQMYSLHKTTMEQNTFPTSLGIVKEMVLDDGFEKITLISNRESDSGRKYLLVSNLNLVHHETVMTMISQCVDQKGSPLDFDTEEEYLVFLLTGRWTLERKLGFYELELEEENLCERLLYNLNIRLKDYILDPYLEDDGARH